MDKIINQNDLKAICAILTDNNIGFSKTELKKFLSDSNIKAVDDGSYNNGITYKIGLNKKDWLYNSFVTEVNNSKSLDCVFRFIETAFNPISYTAMGQRAKYYCLVEEMNKVLCFLGLEINKSGEIVFVKKATNLEEVDERVNHLHKKLYERSIHSEVYKYCIKDYLRKDFFDAVFEASKGLAQRVRDITGLGTDGSRLFETAFSQKDPFLFLMD